MILSYSPFTKSDLLELHKFLGKFNLTYDNQIDFTVILKDNNKIIATASIGESIIKDIAIDYEYQDQNITSVLLTEITNYAYRQQIYHLFLYTKPQYKKIFKSYGFFTIYIDKNILFMENRENGLSNYLHSIKKNTHDNGVLIMHCNPITLGHLYLINYAASHCEHLYLFIVSSNSSLFTSTERYTMVKQACKNISNISIHMTNYYQVSHATFPDYFFHKKEEKYKIQTTLDFNIFMNFIIPILHIKKRFLGTEPHDTVTNLYNEGLKSTFSDIIKVYEIPRYQLNSQIVSASYVRDNLSNFSIVKDYTPKSVHTLLFDYLKKKGYLYEYNC